MSMTPEQMDRLVADHFAFEAADDVDGVMGTLTEDAEHEVIPSPVGALHDRERQREYYQMLFDCIQGSKVTPIRRLYGKDFMVDETLWEGHVSDGKPFLCESRSGDVSFRLLHVFEMRGGKISREQVWCDLAAIQQQLDGAQTG